MIDYVKLTTTDFNHKQLLRTLEFKGWTDLETSEIETNEYGNKKYRSSLHNLNVIVYENSSNKFTLCVLGSIHKFHNNGMHNFNDLNFKDLVTSIDRLSHLLFFNPETCKIQNIEIGVNILPVVKSKTVIKGLLLHKSKRFKSFSFDHSNFHEVIHTNYYIKAYDKAKQYRAKGYILANDIFRFELKYERMSDLVILLNKLGIINREYIVLNDLNNIHVLKAFGELLIKKWNEILYYDYTIRKKDLTKQQQRKLDVWQNINQWESFTKQKRSKQKKLLYKIIREHSSQAQQNIAILIREKFELLLPKGLPLNHNLNIKKDNRLTTIYKDVTITERLPLNRIVKEVNSHTSKRKKEKELEELERIILDYNNYDRQ